MEQRNVQVLRNRNGLRAIHGLGILYPLLKLLLKKNIHSSHSLFIMPNTKERKRSMVLIFISIITKVEFSQLTRCIMQFQIAKPLKKRPESLFVTTI